MLITTRGRKEWMIPKGWPIGGMKAPESVSLMVAQTVVSVGP